ncbi:hypothetical protein Aperf_G00000069847 [Anoplocephala perfoliata]
MDVILLKSISEDAYSHESDPYVNALNHKGIPVDLVETITFTFCGCLFERLCKWRSSHSCIVFCSPRAVSAFTSTNLIGLPEDLCFVVGPATSDFATKVGFAPKGSHTGDAEKLARFIIENYHDDVSKSPVLLLVGAKHNPLLPTKLREAGLDVDEVVVYSSLPNPAFAAQLSSLIKKRKSRPLCLVFFSPSGVELTGPILSDFLLQSSVDIRAVAIGPTTASRIEALGLPLAGTCQSPTPEGLLECLQQLL